MDYVKSPNARLSIVILIISGTCHALLDRFLEENFSDQLHHMDMDDNSQIFSCDFESQCLWTSSNHSDQSDWLLVSPQQPQSAQAGMVPATDHSVGSSDGHFLLLSSAPSAAEASGSCERHLTSPALPRSSGRCVLRLALYEAAPAAGNLTLQIRPVLSGSVLRSVVPTKAREDDPRAGWEVLEAVIGQVDLPFQVTLLYTSCVGSSEAAVALDSLKIMNCDSAPGAAPFGSHCSFEEDACGWSVSDHYGAWRRVAGEELPDSEDVLGVTSGHFLLLQVREADSHREASIRSSSFPPPVSAASCPMRFSLYLSGDFNGSLLVTVVENGTGAAPLLWEKRDGWADDWEDVSLPPAELQRGFYVKVTAAWTEGSNADVALDNILIGGSCFDTDLDSQLSMEDLEEIFRPLQEPSTSEGPLMTWLFNSCGASGPHGPTQAQCDSTYRNKNVSVTVGKEGRLKGVQAWRVPATDRYLISAYGAAGGKGAKNHNKRNNGVFISAVFPLKKGDMLYILVGHQGEDACPGRNPETQKICLGESSVIEEPRREAGAACAGGGGGGGGATYIFRMEEGELVPLLIAAGGGGNGYLEDPESSPDHVPLEQYETSTEHSSANGQTGAAGGGGGWRDSPSPHPRAGKSLVEGAEGGSSCPLALSKLGWSTSGGFGGGGGACTAGGGGGGYRGGDAAPTDEMTADGQNGVSFINRVGEIFLQPLAAMESHGECEIKVQLNCSHCQMQSCKQEEDTRLILCLCDDDEVLASDNVTCIRTVASQGPAPQGQMSASLIWAVVVSTVASSVALICTTLILMWYRRKNDLHAVRGRLQSPEYKLSKIRSSTIMTDYNPNYCFAGKAASLSELKEVPRRNITLLRALGHGAFGEVYEGQVLGMNGDNGPMQVAIKTLPEICSEQDEMDFLMEALIMSKFSHDNIVRCIGVSLNILPRFILLELMTGGDMKSFLRLNRPRSGQTSSLTMRELLQMARDIACGCRYLEENHFIHRDIAARNCLLTCPGPNRVAKIGDFGMARDIYRASYYRKGGRAMLPVKWMPPEAFLEGIFTCKTDTWSFGVLLWEIVSLGYMPYPCKTNQEVLEFVTSGGRMDPPKGCPGPVYRIMTQCWQHCPEHRPNFSTILERINYCTQDPDVINTPLPVEYGPTTEDDCGAVTRPSDQISSGLAPLLVSRSVPRDPPFQLSQPGSAPLPPQPTKPRLLLQRSQPVHHEVKACCEVLEPSWAEPVLPSALVPDGGGGAGGPWQPPEPPHHRPCTRNSSSSGSQRLKNKTKNLWNPTYGSWVLENFRGKKAVAQTQSMPLSGTAPPTSYTQTCTPASESSEAGCDNATSTSATPPPSCLTPAAPPVSSHQKTPAGGTAMAAVDLAKLQSFPCGNVNYAYDERTHEAEGLPSVAPKATEASPSIPPAQSCSSGTSLAAPGFQASSTRMPKLLLKRHSSYGAEDARRQAKAEKPPRDRDSGFSLSEDLSVTPI
ncbi:tyrosine-protein kinase receptor isoform X2 [Betta splendens]|uniref:Tyrosine-protein kinase receptor n=1 Tax=Betta splendens TaxID=158456 RepID=A0A8M1H990_BETSP|nr:tyrosine-protein kinase receptor isoform X2 [Betta splendens]